MADAEGAVWRRARRSCLASADGGIRWVARARLDGEPQAMTAVGDSTVYVATDFGIYA